MEDVDRMCNLFFVFFVCFHFLVVIPLGMVLRYGCRPSGEASSRSVLSSHQNLNTKKDVWNLTGVTKVFSVFAFVSNAQKRGTQEKKWAYYIFASSVISSAP